MSNEQKSDTNLIANTLVGDLGSQHLLYVRYKTIVENYIKFNYPLNDDIDDDVSEIMTKMFLKLKTYDSTKSSLKTWLCTIAKNHIIDSWRGGGIDVFSYDTNVTNNDNCDIVYSSNNLTNNAYNYTSTYNTTEFENNDSINYISKQLTPDDFRMLEMKYLEGYNYEEIGERFNITSTTVSNKVNYIKSKLKKTNAEIM